MREFRSIGVFGLVWLAVGVGCACAIDGEEKSNKAETVVIPLNQIWALDMPGTRDVHEIVKVDTEHVPPHPSVLDRIVRSLSFRRNKQMPGYAVPGKPNRNLIWASMALEKRNDFGPIPTAEDANLTFFAQVSSYRARLLSVRRDGFEIDIEYRFEPQRTSEAQVSFALIPLGRIPAGQYHVKVHQVPMEQKYLDADFEPVSDEQASRLVSGPFSFDVWEPSAPDLGPNENAVEIPLDRIWAHNMPGTKPIRTGLPKEIAPESPLLREIRYKLAPKMEDVGLGFAVEGSEMTALRNAHAVFVDGVAHTKRFAADSEVTIVFFSKGFGRSVRLSKVTHEETNVKLFYHFVPFQSLMSVNTLALVPLGKMLPGTYRVETCELPMQEKYRKRGFRPLAPEIKKGVVSESFSFVVDESGDK